MDVPVDEKAVAALESLYSGPTTTRQLAQAREIFAFLRNEGQVRSYTEVDVSNDAREKQQ